MYRRRTVEHMQRTWDRERGELLALVREQNDRLMLLAGQPWTLPPRPVEDETWLEPLPNGELVYEEQLE